MRKMWGVTDVDALSILADAISDVGSWWCWQAEGNASDVEAHAACGLGLARFVGPGPGLGAPPRGKHLFGSVKVGERGQVVIPKDGAGLDRSRMR